MVVAVLRQLLSLCQAGEAGGEVVLGRRVVGTQLLFLGLCGEVVLLAFVHVLQGDSQTVIVLAALHALVVAQIDHHGHRLGAVADGRRLGGVELAVLAHQTAHDGCVKRSERRRVLHLDFLGVEVRLGTDVAGGEQQFVDAHHRRREADGVLLLASLAVQHLHLAYLRILGAVGILQVDVEVEVLLVGVGLPLVVEVDGAEPVLDGRGRLLVGRAHLDVKDRLLRGDFRVVVAGVIVPLVGVVGVVAVNLGDASAAVEARLHVELVAAVQLLARGVADAETILTVLVPESLIVA